ncbi:hypothetical protein ACFQX6_55265 [Streptosporangium lutulentum]
MNEKLRERIAVLRQRMPDRLLHKREGGREVLRQTPQQLVSGQHRFHGKQPPHSFTLRNDDSMRPPESPLAGFIDESIHTDARLYAVGLVLAAPLSRRTSEDGCVP